MKLRYPNQLSIPFARTVQTERQPLTDFPKLWSEFPDENIKFIHNKKEFYSKLYKNIS